MSRMPARKKIEDSILDQLKNRGSSLAHYADLIRDYMSFWDTKNALAKDIKTRGVMYQDVSAAGKLMWKNNPSIKEQVGVNRQMLSILKELKLTTGSDGGGGGDADDL